MAAAAASVKMGSRVLVTGGAHAGQHGWVFPRGRSRQADDGLVAVVFERAAAAAKEAQQALLPVGDVEGADLGAAELMEQLERLNDAVDRSPLAPLPGQMSSTTKRQDYSIFAPLRMTDRRGERAKAPDHDPRDRARLWGLVTAAVRGDEGCAAAAGALLGLAIGDSVGHPLEFIPVNPGLPDGTAAALFRQPARPFLRPRLSEAGKLVYNKPLNKFALRPGQWTDDASMALCLADTLIARRGYDGRDARLRWHQWWNHGYCNAFRFDEARRRAGRATSVGLGGNIAESLRDVDARLDTAAGARGVAPVYGGDTEDAGNGSLMRLAPVPVALWRKPQEAGHVAALQSRATHPGPDAAACCRFAAHFVAECIRRTEQDPARHQRDVEEDAAAVVDAVVAEFVDAHPPKGDTGLARLRALLRCEPPGETEECWDWRRPQLAIRETIAARRASADGTYNGYPVLPGYFGAYCMDGLAMALWALRLGGGFSAVVVRCVNLLGDADTTGAIAGQMAGALYGWSGIIADQLGKTFLKNLRTWDPYAEVMLRAVLLYHFPPEHAVIPGGGDTAGSLGRRGAGGALGSPAKRRRTE